MLGPATVLFWLKHFERVFGRTERICEIGAQEVNFKGHERILREFVDRFPEGARRVTSGDIDRLAGCALAGELYTALGLSYVSMDITAVRDSIVLDLNYDDAPEDCLNSYDLVTNLGTTEHIANQLNAFKVIHDITKPGGYMYHELPYTGFLTHGLVNYTPKFFWMLCKSNFYEYVEMMVIASHIPEPMHGDVLAGARFIVSEDGRMRERIFDTGPGSGSSDGFRCQDSGIFCLMRKTFDAPFVPPVDGDVGNLAPAAKKRYWSLAEPDAFERLVERKNKQ